MTPPAGDGALREAVQGRGSDGFLVGANLPWVEYGDFGANAWHPRGGLAQRADLPRVADALARLANGGVEAVRWFLLCDGRAGIRFAGEEPVGLDEAVFADVDAALDLASRARIQLVPVLFDFLWCAPRRIVNGVQIGGRARIWQTTGGRQRLLETCVAPLLSRYGREAAVLAWDVLNEPEWITRRAGTWRPWRTLSVAGMRAWLAGLVAVVHAETRHMATVGSASARWLWLVRDLGLDVYQPHWYDHLDRRAPLGSALGRAVLDRPAWLGELPTRGSRHDVATLYARAQQAGYAGAFAWSVLADDSASDFATAGPALAGWTEAARLSPHAPDADDRLSPSGTTADAADAAGARGAHS